jgi:cellulose synthase operon protein C
MKRWCWLLLAALAAAPAVAADNKKDDKKAKEAPAAPAPAAQDAVKEAESKLAAGDAEKAIALLEKAARGDPKAALRLGRLRESRGELLPAEDAYKAAAKRLTGSDKGEALGRAAVVQDARGVPEAAATAEAAIAADPDGLWPTIAISYWRAHEGKADEAVALAQKAVAGGGGAAAKAALGHALAARRDWPGAEAAYREAVAAEPAALAPVVGLAAVLCETGRAAEAEPMLQAAIDAAPGSAEGYKEMARVKIALGKALDALAAANLAGAMSENDPEAQALVVEAKGLVVEERVTRALEKAGAGQVDRAVWELTELRDANPGSARVRLALGQAQVARKDADAALAELQKAVELDPKNAEAQYQLGNVFQLMKQNPAAAVDPFAKAVAIEPANVLFRTSLGIALLRAGQTERAVEELTKVTSTEGYSGSQAWLYLGAAQLKASRFAEAVAALEKALAAKPDDAEAEAYLAWSCFGLKDAGGFKAHGAKARALGWKDPALLDRLARVEAGQAIK